MQPFGLVNEETQKTDNQSILFNNVPIWLLAYCVCGVQTSCVCLFFFYPGIVLHCTFYAGGRGFMQGGVPYGRHLFY